MDIKTIEISVPAQMEPLLKAAGVTLDQVIQSYLFDLGQVCHGSNGSDERNMAERYFRRCWYGWGDDGRIDYVISTLAYIRTRWGLYGADRSG